MTIAELEACTDDVLTCEAVAGVLKCNPHTLRLQAASRPELLGFPVIVMGSRVKIPRIAFLKFMKGETWKKITK